MKNEKLYFEKLKRIAACALLVVAFGICAFGCEKAKNGTNGSASNVVSRDGKVLVDGSDTGFDNNTLSGKISVATDTPQYGTVEGGGRYALNSAVIVSAKPDDGYVFTCWKNEKNEIVSYDENMIIRASEADRRFVAVFEIDKNKVSVEVKIRADKSLPSSATVEGCGRFPFGKSYTLKVVAENEDALKSGTVFFYEITAEQFADENFSVSETMTACSRGQTAVFDVDGIDDKYYIAAFMKNSGNISIISSCQIETKSSDEFYGKSYISAINGKTIDENADETPLVWPGDVVTVKAVPSSAPKFNNPQSYQKYSTVERSDFVCWTNEATGKTLSEKDEFSFVAKSHFSIKAVFSPRVVVHFVGNYVCPVLVTKDDTFSHTSSTREYDGAMASFLPKEKFSVFAYYDGLFGAKTANRKDKFSWEYSYDSVNWRTLSYKKQAYIEIPAEHVTDIYLRINFV